MASYMKGKLPTFKVTQRLRGGLTVHRSVPRGRGSPAPSLHAVKQQASATAWGEIRPLLLRAAVESSAMPTMQLCNVCAETALYRCIQCGSNAYYCHKCFNQVHRATNIFHNGEVWEVCVYYVLFIIVEISVCCV